MKSSFVRPQSQHQCSCQFSISRGWWMCYTPTEIITHILRPSSKIIAYRSSLVPCQCEVWTKCSDINALLKINGLSIVPLNSLLFLAWGKILLLVYTLKIYVRNKVHDVPFILISSMDLMVCNAPKKIYIIYLTQWILTFLWHT